MTIFRSLLSIVLVLVTTLLVSCGGPSATTPPTYTAEKIQQIQSYLTPIKTWRERMLELANFIQEENWVDTKSFIHGPLGQLRQQLSYVSRNLLPDDQKQAQELAKDLFYHLERIDTAANEEDYDVAVRQYNEAIKDLDAFLNLIPEPQETA